ncbi:LysR family transcriptional regulator [Lampropedia puyangensis]|uniref:LysR family transcriptional regulator n=1 Tax=Lampropedia puyangensis TaxID=1330072 RepID=A0A4S8FDI1_9BURK|nr:LysR family transcriptional regulator [Lampropedia puyangensis]THU05339.1 LysR family transcriptional regulator [Lampropedia puyangensis]
MLRLPSLPALRCFEAAARLQHFSRAAQELCLTHGAISRAVRLLEADLNTPLFERRNRQVFLTPAGTQLYKAVHEGFETISQTTQNLRLQSQREQMPLVLSCEPTLLMRWLIPRWQDFIAQHPEPMVHLVAGGGPIDLETGIDFAIRRNDFAIPSHYQAQPLFTERFGPVCAPEKMQTWFTKKAGQWQLKPTAPLLHTRTRLDAWPQWKFITKPSSNTQSHKTEKQISTSTPEAGLVFDHFYFSLQAAIAGLGVAIGPWHMVKNDLDQQLLTAPLGFLEDGSQYMLLSREDMHHPRVEGTRQALCHWLTHEEATMDTRT